MLSFLVPINFFYFLRFEKKRALVVCLKYLSVWSRAGFNNILYGLPERAVITPVRNPVPVQRVKCSCQFVQEKHLHVIS